MPVAPVIMLIRHAEKPTEGVAGVKENGEQSSHDLIVRGWQRAIQSAILRHELPVGGDLC